MLIPAQETGIYYLQSRYYDPAIGRFINADVYTSTGQGILGNNMFAYCRNNPANRKDTLGTKDLCATSNEDDNNSLNDYGPVTGGGGGASGSGYTNGGGGNDGSNSPGNAGSGTFGGSTGSPLGSNAAPPMPPAQQANPLENIRYTDKVLNDMTKRDFHGFPEIVDNYDAYGKTSYQVGGDGQTYTHLHIPGGYLGHSGYFEYIWDGSGVCNHRLFVMKNIN